MNDNIKTVLLTYKKWHDKTMISFDFRNPLNYVFITFAGAPLGERYMKRIIDLLCEREEIPQFTPHHFRQFKIQLSNHIPFSTVAALVGDTPETINKTYAHSFEKDEIAASNIMDEIITLNSFDENEK